MEKNKYIIENLVKNHKFSSFIDLYNFLDNKDAIFNLDVIDVLIDEIIDLYKQKQFNYYYFIQYQILVNKIVNNSNFAYTYNENAEIVSLLEMVRILTLFLKENALRYFSGSLDVSVKIVEVNKRGLKIKHFAYQSDYNLGDLVYINSPRPENFYLVSDFYETKLRDLLSYVVHISSFQVYNFNISFTEIAKYNVTNIKDEHVVEVVVDGENILAKTIFKHYPSQEVEVSVAGGSKNGYIIGDVFFGSKKIENYIIRNISHEKKKYLKEKRNIDNDVITYLFQGWNLDSLKNSIKNMNRKKYIVVFSVYEKLLSLLEKNKNKSLNEIEPLNLYYRPYINFLLKNIDVNTFYYQNNGVIFSILHYLSLLKRQNNNALNFLLDEKYDININLVDINVYGKIKTCFAYDYLFQIGEPIFIQVDDIYPIAFIHRLRQLPLYQILDEIEYFLSTEIVQIKNLKKEVIKKSTFNNKVILVKVYDGNSTIIAISENYVPYIGESVKINNEFAIVVSEPIAVDKNDIDVGEYVCLKDINFLS